MTLSTGEIVVRLAVAAALSAPIGIERELRGQDAGFRTHLLLGLGAALFGAVSVGAFDAVVGDDGTPSGVTVDPARIASYVAAGIGFIGGGAILKHAGKVEGLTTASSVWVVSAIGLAAGLGFWAGAVTAAVITVVALAALKPVDDLLGRLGTGATTLRVSMATGERGAHAVVAVVTATAPGLLRRVRVAPSEDGVVEIAVELGARTDASTIDELCRRIGEHPDVRSLAVDGR